MPVPLTKTRSMEALWLLSSCWNAALIHQQNRRRVQNAWNWWTKRYRMAYPPLRQQGLVWVLYWGASSAYLAHKADGDAGDPVTTHALLAGIVCLEPAESQQLPLMVRDIITRTATTARWVASETRSLLGGGFCFVCESCATTGMALGRPCAASLAGPLSAWYRSQVALLRASIIGK